MLQHQFLRDSTEESRISHLERPLLPWQHRRREAPSRSNNQSPLLGVNLYYASMREWGWCGGGVGGWGGTVRGYKEQTMASHLSQRPYGSMNKAMIWIKAVNPVSAWSLSACQWYVGQRDSCEEPLIGETSLERQSAPGHVENRRHGVRKTSGYKNQRITMNKASQGASEASSVTLVLSQSIPKKCCIPRVRDCEWLTDSLSRGRCFAAERSGWLHREEIHEGRKWH